MCLPKKQQWANNNDIANTREQVHDKEQMTTKTFREVALEEVRTNQDKVDKIIQMHGIYSMRIYIAYP